MYNRKVDKPPFHASNPKLQTRCIMRTGLLKLNKSWKYKIILRI